MKNLLRFSLLVFFLPLAAQTLQNPVHIPIASNPTNAASTDFNGDGRPDLYYYDSNGVHILLARSDGSYPTTPTTPIPTYPLSCAPYELNGDSYADLVCTSRGSNQPGVLSVYFGKGNGTFQAPVNTSFPVDSEETTPELIPLAAGDLNHDGHVDLVVYEYLSGQLYSLLGDGAGHFKVSAPYYLATQFNSSYATLADVNGDGIPDLLYPSGPAVYLGKGDGTFAAPTSNRFYNCIFADFDDDGHLDAACGSYGPNMNAMFILKGNHDGTFDPTPIYIKQLAYSDFTYPVAARDLNGDGILDMLVESSDGLAVYLGKPGLQFASPVHYAFTTVASSGSRYAPSLIEDFNGDGHLDIAMVGGNGIYIALGHANGTFTAPPIFQSGTTIRSSGIADFNEDGFPDVVTSGEASVELKLGKGDGTFAAAIAGPIPEWPAGTTSGTSSTLLVGDFNGDGHQDVLADYLPNPDNSWLSYIFPGNGKGRFGTPVETSSTLGYLPVRGSIVADMNHDRRDDLISITSNSQTSSATVEVFLSQGNGSFVPAFTTVPSGATTPAAADFDGDGRMDLVLPTVTGTYYNSSAYVRFLKGRGDGTFQVTAHIVTIPRVSSSGNFSIMKTITGDFDHDGKMDFALIVTNSFEDGYDPGPTALDVFYGNGDGTFSAAVTAAVPSSGYTDVAAADFNQDGIGDFALNAPAPFTGANTLAVIQGRTHRTFSPEVDYEAGLGIDSFAVADFNQDGLPDVMVVNGLNSFTVLLDQAASSTVLHANTAASAFGQPVTFTATVSTTAKLTRQPNSSAQVTLYGLPRGVVSLPLTFTTSGSTITGTAAYTTSSLSPGTYKLSAGFAGIGDLTASASAVLVHTVSASATATHLAASATSVDLHHAVTFTATVSAGSFIPTGSVQFFNGSTLLGSAALSSGKASFSTSSLSAGAHSITAKYVGSVDFASSTSAAVRITVINPTYTLSSYTKGLALAPGSTSGNSAALTLGSIGGFAGTVNLTCSVVFNGTGVVHDPPACRIAPASVSLASGSVSSTLSITTVKANPGTTAGNYTITIRSSSNATTAPPAPLAMDLLVY